MTCLGRELLEKIQKPLVFQSSSDGFDSRHSPPPEVRENAD